ncbi:MAG: class I SAM-dependent methyltransferase [Alphaproteobacteria bacterium]
MYRSVYDLKGFYNSRAGRVVARVLGGRINDIWPDVKNLSVLGCGYAVPYLRDYIGHAERVIAVMPAAQGADAWPEDAKNLVCLAEEGELPFENSSIDRVILIHDVEFSQFLESKLQETWRVLKPNGRVLVIVPNRRGLWSRADWSPLGQGTPYSARQIHYYLRDNLFVHERTEEALFMLPLPYPVILKWADLFERLGKRYWSIMPGVHIVEASKQLYAKANPGSGTRVAVRGKGFVPRPVPQGFTRSRSSL